MHLAYVPRILTPTGLASVFLPITRDPSLWSDLTEHRPEDRYWVRLEVNLGTDPAVSIHAHPSQPTSMKSYSVEDSRARAVRIVRSDNPDSERVR